MVCISFAVATIFVSNGVRRCVSQIMRIGFFLPSILQFSMGICQYRSHTHHNCSIFMSLLLHMSSCRFRCNPFGCTCVGCDFSVHRHRIFHYHKGTLCLNIVKKHLIQAVTFLLQHVLRYLYAMLSQNPNSLSCHKWIGVCRADHHAPNACLQNGIHTRRLSALMAARL